MTKAELKALRSRYEKAQKAADDAHADAIAAKTKAAELAQEAATLYAEVDLEDWIQAQESLGIDREDLDLEEMTVRTIARGPNYDHTPGA